MPAIINTHVCVLASIVSKKKALSGWKCFPFIKRLQFADTEQTVSIKRKDSKCTKRQGVHKCVKDKNTEYVKIRDLHTTSD